MKYLFLLILFISICNISYAASIAEELTKLNNLFKEGAITKEEFSKAKSILLKTDNVNETTEEIKKSKKRSSKKKINKKEEKQKIVNKRTNEDLTKSYIHLDEINELGTNLKL